MQCKNVETSFKKVSSKIQLTTKAIIICHPQVLELYIRLIVVSSFILRRRVCSIMLNSSYEIKVRQYLFVCSYLAKASFFVRKTLFIDVTLFTSSETLSYLDMSPTPLSSSVLLFKTLQLNLNLFD